MSSLTPLALLAFVLAPFVGCADPTETEPVDDVIQLPACAGVTPVSGLDSSWTAVVSGLDQPLFLTAVAGDERRLYVVEQPGRVRVIVDDLLAPAPFLDISDRVLCCGERGLLSVAFHPQFASNRRLFVNYTDATGDVILAEYTAASADAANAASERVLLRIEHRQFSNHNGGQLVFGRDGYLFMSVGDGGGGGDPLGAAQDTSRLLGKLLRLDVDGPTLAPPGNPFANEVWALGLRNPWRFSFDRETGDLYLGDVGQSAREEIDFEPAASAGGRNYGWPAMEGSICFADPQCLERGFVSPLLDYDRRGGACSVVGGYVYRGCVLADLRGRYLYGDFCAGFVRAVRVTSGVVVEELDLTPITGPVAQLVSFGEDSRGELYAVSLSGSVLRLVAR